MDHFIFWTPKQVNFILRTFQIDESRADGGGGGGGEGYLGWGGLNLPPPVTFYPTPSHFFVDFAF